MGLIKISDLSLYDTNSRRTTNGDTIEELAQSITEVGLINPLTVIETMDGYKVIAGQRRLKALQLTEIKTAQCTVVESDMTEEGILEIQITENAQREDVHPLEEMTAINKLMKKYSLIDIANRLGKSEIHIKQIRRLNNLSKQLKILFINNAMTLGQAFVFAQFSKDVQDENLDAFSRVIDEDEDEFFYLNYTPKDLKEKIKSSSRQFSLAPFDITDKSLAPKDLGSCSKCKFNSTSGESLFDDNPDGRCLNVDCFDFKLKTDLANKIKAAKKEYPELVGLSLSGYSTLEEFARMKVYSAHDFDRVNPEDATTHTKTAIVVESHFGDPSAQGTIVWMNKTKTAKSTEHSDETPLEGDERKMITRHERLLRKAGVEARMQIFEDLISNPTEGTETTIMRAPVLDRVLESLVREGDQKLIRQWFGMGDSRLNDGQFVDAIKKAEHYPKESSYLVWFIAFVFITDMLGSKYAADRTDKKDSFISFAKNCGVDVTAIITETLSEAKETIVQDKKDLKSKVKAYNSMQNRYAEIVQNATPVELIKGTIWRVGDDLPDELAMTKRVCRKFGVKAPAAASNEDLHKVLLDRFNELRRHTIE